jgi:N-methylhydantoinase A
MGTRVCIDIGGTFTDLAVVNETDGQLRVFKSSTTPHDYAEGILKCLELAVDYYGLEMSAFLEDCSSHAGGAMAFGTTIATNALIQKKVAKVGLICTQGHRDILTFREGGKEDPFDWDLDYPDPYVPRYLTLPVTERIDAQGEVVRALDEASAREAIRQFLDYNVEVIAVALLWSIVSPNHELRIGEIIDEMAPGQPYVLSHQVNPIVGEYRRTISTVINASLIPIVGPYIRAFDEQLKSLGYQGNLSIISCFGGILSIADTETRPIYVVDSGPTGAPVAGLLFAEQEYNRGEVVTCDMGGTSFDVSRVTDGGISFTSEAKVGFDFLGIRKVDTKSIGAGGGSIAWVDSGGLLHVGPESAGAEPGPACYRRGGDRPTVTDANVVLGYLNPERILGGRMTLERDLAHEVIQRDVARPLKLDIMEAAFSIWNTVCVNMTDAIRTITSWEGIDPREYVFVSGGGAAGMHIIPMLRDLEVKDLIIPKAAGVLSAVGGLASDMVSEFQLNFDTETVTFDYDGVNDVLNRLATMGTDFLMANRIPEERRALEFSVDARYLSQPWELAIPLSKGRFEGNEDVAALVEDFHRIHERMRGSREPGQKLALSNWRLKAVGRTIKPEFVPAEAGHETPSEEAILSRRKAFFKDLGGLVETPAYGGDMLKPGSVIESPAIIEEMATTIVIFPGSRAVVSKHGHYLIEVSRTERKE